MKVLHLVKTGAGAAWAVQQIGILSGRGIEVVVALPTADCSRAADYRAAGAEVVAADLDFTLDRPWRLGVALERCRRLVAKTKPDLIHSHFVSTTLVARLALGREHEIPRLFQVPGVLHLEHAAFRRLDVATSGAQDSWIASCRWTREAYLRLGMPPDRVFLSYYGTAVDRLRVVGAGRLRAELGLDAHVPLVGMVAYVYRPKWFLGQRRGIKGHEDFIDAVRQLRASRPSLRAVVVGGAWDGADRYERGLRERAAAACGEAIRFIGVRSDVPAIYADLDVAVHPSLSENCGGAVESLAAGCPTVATEVGGLPDVVRDGETGWLVPPRDPGALARAIDEALACRTEARHRASRGQALVQELFDVRRTGNEIADHYYSVLRRRGVLTRTSHDMAGAAC